MANNKLNLLVILLFVSTIVFSQGKRRTSEKQNMKWNYDLECVGVGNQGEYLVKVFSFYRKKKRKGLDLELAKKNALHGIIFKGINSKSRDCVSQPALIKDANVEEQKSEYFDSFFKEGGKYKKFVNLTTGGAVESGDRMQVRIGKKKYLKVGLVISVNKDLLRKELEAAGIIRKLNAGF
ncbi:hypothetical protein [Polaribacter marinivivus]|uniref:Uncharacterized protein n=1 Tax=Polaribacter marinivivus TaxID=1524260 RepID=A0ABV8R831_9FLAO|nr:hypothetical protein [uncultured Polaribacter sp.]